MNSRRLGQLKFAEKLRQAPAAQPQFAFVRPHPLFRIRPLVVIRADGLYAQGDPDQTLQI
jgi:hypothetical protein